MVVITAWLWCKSSAKKKEAVSLASQRYQTDSDWHGWSCLLPWFPTWFRFMKYFTAPRIGTLWNAQAKLTTSWTHGEKAQINYEEHVYETCMKHVWTTTCTCIYIHIITWSCTSGLGDYVSPKIHRSERLPAANFVSQGYSARRSRNAEMAYLQATGYQVFKRSILSENWPNLNGKGEKIFEVPWKMSRTWYNTICSHTEKKLERWLNHHASDRHDVTSIIQQLTTWPFVGSSRPVCCETQHTGWTDGRYVCFWLKINCHDVMRKKCVQGTKSDMSFTDIYIRYVLWGGVVQYTF